MTTLLVTATGGHLSEMHQLAGRIAEVGEDRLWVTFDSEQSRDLLRGERVEFVRSTPPRDSRAVLGNILPASRLLSRERVTRVVSNGSGIALSYLPLAHFKSIPVHYVECAARTRGPSLTGRLLARIPGIRLYTQYPRWADERWHFAGSVLDNFDVELSATPVPVRRVLVTIGTLFPFRRLVERLIDELPPDVEVIWQLGDTDVDGLGVDSHRSLPPARLAELAASVDVVVAHSGIGSALLALEAGRLPILIPREMGEGEHVDDHQYELADELNGRGMAISRTVDQLSFADLERAAASTVSRAEPPPFRLGPERLGIPAPLVHPASI